MSEESKLKAGPNASELEWAFEAAVEGLDVNGQAETAQDLDDLKESDEEEVQPNGVAGSPDTTTGTSTAAAKKKKKGKALAKLRKKLAGNNSSAKDASADAGPSATSTQDTLTQQQVYDRVLETVEAAQGKEAASKMTPEVLAELLRSARQAQGPSAAGPSKSKTAPTSGVKGKTSVPPLSFVC